VEITMAIRLSVSEQRAAGADAALRLPPITRIAAGVFGVLFILMGLAAIPATAWLLRERAAWGPVVGVACMTGAMAPGWLMLRAAHTGYSPPWDGEDEL
jgi:hypothetical protein